MEKEKCRIATRSGGGEKDVVRGIQTKEMEVEAEEEEITMVSEDV